MVSIGEQLCSQRNRELLEREYTLNDASHAIEIITQIGFVFCFLHF